MRNATNRGFQYTQELTWEGKKIVKVNRLHTQHSGQPRIKKKRITQNITQKTRSKRLGCKCRINFIKQEDTHDGSCIFYSAASIYIIPATSGWATPATFAIFTSSTIFIFVSPAIYTYPYTW
eukprot:g70082.t1